MTCFRLFRLHALPHATDNGDTFRVQLAILLVRLEKAGGEFDLVGGHLFLQFLHVVAQFIEVFHLAAGLLLHGHLPPKPLVLGFIGGAISETWRPTLLQISYKAELALRGNLDVSSFEIAIMLMLDRLLFTQLLSA